MQITFTIEATPENIEKLKAFCTEEKAVKKTKSAVYIEKAKTENVHIEEAKAEDTNAEEAPFDADAKEEQKITKTDVRAIALKLSKAGKSETLKEIFAKFGAEKFSDVPEAKYPELMRELVSVNG